MAICPLTYTSGKGAYDQEVSGFDYCVKEKCAWWNSSEKNCAVSMLAHYVSMLWEHRYNTER